MVESTANEKADKVFSEVRKCLVAALGVDEEEVKYESSLIRDLGAESIDFLDIIFRLEKEFSIKIPRGDLFPENLMNNPAYVQSGKITEAGVAELKKRNPYADFSTFEKDPQVSKLQDTFTVKMICGYIADKIDTK